MGFKKVDGQMDLRDWITHYLLGKENAILLRWEQIFPFHKAVMQCQQFHQLDLGNVQ